MGIRAVRARKHANTHAVGFGIAGPYLWFPSRLHLLFFGCGASARFPSSSFLSGSMRSSRVFLDCNPAFEGMPSIC